MSRFLEAAALAALIAAPFATLIASPAAAGEFNLGREATPNEVAAWNIDVRPDGLGLPEGHGTVAEGEEIFGERCAVCHGDFGEGVGRWPVLAGGQGTLTAARPEKTIGSYWPFLSTAYDYIHRAMPFGDAQSLEPNEVYAIVAYLLYMNDVIDDDEFELNNENFTSIHMPNEDGFIDDPRPDTPLLADGTPCMENCKEDVHITMHAAVLDVTPEGDGIPEGAETDDGAGSASAAEPAATTEVAAAPEPAPEPEPAPAAEPEPAPAAAPDPALVAAGEKIYKKCKACHQVGDKAKHRVGPILNGVLGRTAGTMEGFKYSKAMIAKGEEGLVWTPETLDAYLEKPKAYVPKTKMSFAGLKKAEDRAAVTAYLSQFTE